MKLTAVGVHKEGQLERYAFLYKYPTHAEMWSIVETDHPKGAVALAEASNSYLGPLGFMDREDNWWLVWYTFSPTNEGADKWLEKEIQFNSDWSDTNMWHGE